MYIALIITTLISAFISLFYASIYLKQAHKTITADYAFVRSLVAALVVVLVIIINDRPMVYMVALLMALIQLGDSFIGMRVGDKTKTYGPLVTAIISLILLAVNLLFAV